MDKSYVTELWELLPQGFIRFRMSFVLNGRLSGDLLTMGCLNHQLNNI